MLCRYHGDSYVFYDLEEGSSQARRVARSEVPPGSLEYGWCGHTNAMLIGLVVRDRKLHLWLAGKMWPMADLALETSMAPDKSLHHRISSGSTIVVELSEGAEDADLPGGLLQPAWESFLHFICRLLRPLHSLEVIESAFPSEV